MIKQNAFCGAFQATKDQPMILLHLQALSRLKELKINGTGPVIMREEKSGSDYLVSSGRIISMTGSLLV